MKLNIAQIKEIARGAVRIIEDDRNIQLYRFTKEQEELYKATKGDFYRKCFATAGIKLVFKTDSESLFLKMSISHGGSRGYFSIDIFVDGRPIGYLDNFSDSPLPENYTQGKFPLGEYSKAFDLGKGVKTVCVYLPWSMKTVIEEISVDDGAFIEAVKPKKKLLAYGDSITQGYDALRPSMRYAARLAEALDAEEFNKAIGGEVFFPELAELPDEFTPDYITVAYGTNDWRKTDSTEFKDKCKAFYTTISKNYPDSKIFAITPIWRKDCNEQTKFGPFETVEENIRDAVKTLNNVTVISGFDFVPKDEKYFADFRLHPNDEGFERYFNNLYSKIRSEI